MFILNRYFLRVAVKPIITSVIAILTLVSLSELIDKLDKFISAGVGAAKVAEYMLLSMPFQAVEITPVAVMLGVLFTLSALGKHGEIAASVSSGISPWKLARIFLALGLAASFGVLLLHETLIPVATRKAKQIYQQDVKRIGAFPQTKFDHLNVSGKENRIYTIGAYDANLQVMEKVLVETLFDGKPHEQVSAGNAVWTGTLWRFSHGILRHFSPDGLRVSGQEYFDVKDLPYTDKPQDITKEDVDAEGVNYKEYNRYLRHLRALGISTRKEEVELHIKLAFPLASFVVVFLSLPLGLASGIVARAGSGRVITITYALVTSFAYLGTLEVGRALGHTYIPPIIGAWLANLVFLAAGAVLWIKNVW